MRVLVAGGAGFIGANMCARLLDRGDRVVCVDNLVTGSAEQVKELLKRDQFSFVEADIAVGVPVEGPFDAVLNLACPASPGRLRSPFPGDPGCRQPRPPESSGRGRRF
jgi:nucleoside-diphosphate-sugar epimerase